MKRTFLLLFSVAVMLLTACGGDKGGNRDFSGSFTDEFNNKFVLNDDYTGTLQFDGNEKVFQIKWSDGSDHKRLYATIEFNGDPNYYFLRNGKLYRHRKDMEDGHPAINITYDE